MEELKRVGGRATGAGEGRRQAAGRQTAGGERAEGQPRDNEGKRPLTEA